MLELPKQAVQSAKGGGRKRRVKLFSK